MRTGWLAGRRANRVKELEQRVAVAEHIVRAIWPYALSGSVNNGSRGTRDQVVMEELLDRALYDDVRRIINDEQWMAFDNHLVPGPPVPDMWEPGRED